MIRNRGIARVRDALLVLSILGVALIPQSARASVITFSDMQALMSTDIDPLTGGGTVALLVDSSRFGPGGFAGGQAGVINGVFTPLGPFQWRGGPFGGAPPADGTVAIEFNIDPGGNVGGVDPTTFQLIAGITNGVFTPLGELDFTNVTGTFGSLNLANVLLHDVNAQGVQTGTTFDVDPFTVSQVPLPAAAWMFLTALGGLGLVGWRRNRTAAA